MSEFREQALPLFGESGQDGEMAGVPAKRRFDLAKIDSWAAVLQWAAERAFALVASTAGAAVIGYAAKATTWIAQFGPITWAGLAVATFLGIYWMMVSGRSILARSRLDRASAMIAERAAEHATVNPKAEDFRNQRIKLADLYTPTGDPLSDRTFRRCDLIGPAVVWLSPQTVFNQNRIDQVEFVRVNAQTARMWPNKLAFVRGSIVECHLLNVIFLVDETYKETFEGMWDGAILQWMNDPIPQAEAPKLLAPPDTEPETTP